MAQQQLTRKQRERYVAKGKLSTGSRAPTTSTSKPPSSGKATTAKPTTTPPPSPSKGDIFDTPKARKYTQTFNEITGEDNKDPGSIIPRMFDVTLAKQSIFASGPTPVREINGDDVRSHMFELLGHLGWERTLWFMAQCARLWAELPGPVEFTEGQKELMHKVSSRLNELNLDARSMDLCSKGPVRR